MKEEIIDYVLSLTEEQAEKIISNLPLLLSLFEADIPPDQMELHLLCQ